MRAGSLRHRITIQTPTATQDAAGQPVLTWSTFGGTTQIPAKVESVTGGERIRGKQVAAEATIVFTIRCISGVTTQMRVLYDSRTLGIVRVSDPYGDRRELRIECKE